MTSHCITSVYLILSVEHEDRVLSNAVFSALSESVVVVLGRYKFFF